jgi:hypothetical protein
MFLARSGEISKKPASQCCFGEFSPDCRHLLLNRQRIFLATKSIARAKSYGKDTPGRTPYGSMARDSLSGFLDCALLILSGARIFEALRSK